MEYQREFSTQARARFEAEMLKAGTQLEQQRDQLPGSPFGPVIADEENLRKYILQVFLVFAQEAFKLGSQGQWTVDRIRSEAVEFLRRFTIEAYYDNGYDKDGRKLREMVSNSNGSILPEVQREFKKSVEWRQFVQELLAVAEQQARGSPRSGGGDAVAAERAALLQDYKKEGLKRGIRIIDKMIAEAASSNWHDRTPVQRWKRNDPRSKLGDDAAIRRVLQKKPHLNN